jgi:hypothetical protein
VSWFGPSPVNTHSSSARVKRQASSCDQKIHKAEKQLASRLYANEKEGVSMNLFPHKNGTKEIIKVWLTKFTHRIDTASQFAVLQEGVLGLPGITIGLCMPNPRAPKLKASEDFGFSCQRATIGDTFNLFLPLQEESVDGTTHRPKNRGIDFQFDQARKKMKVSLCLRRAMPGDGHDRRLFGLAPQLNIPVDCLGDDDSIGSSSDSSKEEEGVPQQAVLLQRMDLLGNNDYLLLVQRVLNLRTCVVVNVQESTYTNFVVGSKRVLMMDEAVELYREYHDIY